MQHDDQLDQVTFICKCRERFECAPARIEDYPEDTAHPWAYFAECPRCGKEAGQAHWERSLMKAHLSATGPRTPEGKARSAENLKLAKTPEILARTRYNAMKHGIYARSATFFPAKPGRYPQCETCEFLKTCKHGEPCQKRTELFLRHHVAVKSGSPSLLAELNADMQASVHAIMQDMLVAVIGSGVEIKAPVWYYDKEGGCHFVKYVDDKGDVQQLFDISAHPLLKPLMDFLSKNNMTLSDMNLTARQQEDEEVALGHLDHHRTSADKSLEFQQRTTEAIEGLASAVQRGRAALEHDPVLIEHKEAT